MKSDQLIHLLLILDFGISGLCEISLQQKESFQLFDILENPKSYNKAVGPFQNLTGPLIVESSFFIRNFKIDDIKGIAFVDLTLSLYWRDKRLKYSTINFSADKFTDSVRLTDTSKVWIPDAFFRNSFMTKRMESVYPENFIQINKNGSIVYSSRFILDINCPMDLKLFPHDTQECKLFLSSYAHTIKELMFVFVGNYSLVQKRQDLQLGQKLSIFGVTRGYCESKTPTGAYPCLKLTFHLKRIFHYYLLEFYLPCISLVTLAFFSEVLDASMILPRLILTVGSLLSLGILYMYFVQTLPKVPYWTALDVFYGVSFWIVQISVLNTLISYNSSTKPPEEVDPDQEFTLFQLLYRKMKRTRNTFMKILIIGSYFIFLCYYFDNYDNS